MGGGGGPVCENFIVDVWGAKSKHWLLLSRRCAARSLFQRLVRIRKRIRADRSIFRRAEKRAVRDKRQQRAATINKNAPGGKLTCAMLSDTGIADASKDRHAPLKKLAKSRSERCFVGAVLALALRAAAGRDWRHALRPWRQARQRNRPTQMLPVAVGMLSETSVNSSTRSPCHWNGPRASSATARPG